jgi:hypothetical protein
MDGWMDGYTERKRERDREKKRRREIETQREGDTERDREREREKKKERKRKREREREREGGRARARARVRAKAKAKAFGPSVPSLRSAAIFAPQQPTAPIGFLYLQLPPPPCAVLLVGTCSRWMDRQPANQNQQIRRSLWVLRFLLQ